MVGGLVSPVAEPTPDETNGRDEVEDYMASLDRTVSTCMSRVPE